MITPGEDVEVHALHQRGWTISAIARHVGRDRKTVRAYLIGTRTPCARKGFDPDSFVDYVDCLVARFADDAQFLVLNAL